MLTKIIKQEIIYIRILASVIRGNTLRLIYKPSFKRFPEILDKSNSDKTNTTNERKQKGVLIDPEVLEAIKSSS